MLLAFYQVNNSQGFDRNTFNDISDKPEEMKKRLAQLRDDELCIYDMNHYGYGSVPSPNMVDFEEDYNDEMLDGGWWVVTVPDSEHKPAERDDVPQFAIEKPADVGRFFHWLVFERRVNFHPDDDFTDYVAVEGGERTFTDLQAERLNKVMEQCFEVCQQYDRDIYEIGIRTLGLYHYCDKNDTLANFCKNYNPDAKPEFTRKQMENAVMLAADLYQRLYDSDPERLRGGALEVAGTIISEAVKMEAWLTEKYGPDDEEYLDRLEEYERQVISDYDLQDEDATGEEWEDIIIRCSEAFCEHHWTKRSLRQVADELGIDTTDLTD